jgi:choline dehydrogenase
MLGGEQCQAKARIETILSAGSIGSPAIMQRSGIGNAHTLQKLGISIIHELPGCAAFSKFRGSRHSTKRLIASGARL